MNDPLPGPRLRIDRFLGTREPTGPRLYAAHHEVARRTRQSVDAGRLHASVEALAGPRSRLNAPLGMARTETYLGGELQAAGWRVERHEFSLDHALAYTDQPFGKVPVVYPRLEGANLIAIREEPSLDAVLVVAHHDTVPASPGADDNASGLAVLLEVARLLPRMTRQTVVLAVADLEEVGMVGSRVMVERHLGRWNVRGAIVLDAVGFRGGRTDAQGWPKGMGLLYPGQLRRIENRQRAGWMAVLYRRPSQRAASTLAAWLRACAPDGEVVLLRDPTDPPFTGAIVRRLPGARAFARSDHQSFWDAGLPAILLSDVAPWRNPNYHLPSDTPDTLDYELLADVTAAVILTARTIAGD